MKKRFQPLILLILLLANAALNACGDSAIAPTATLNPGQKATYEANIKATMIAQMAATEAASTPILPDSSLSSGEDYVKPTPTPGPSPALNGKLPNLAQVPAPATTPTKAQNTGTWGGVLGGVTAAALSPDLKWLAVGNLYQIWLVEMATGKIQDYFISSADDEERGAVSFSWTADGRKLAAGSFHGLINLWRWDSIENKLRPGPARLEPLQSSNSFGEQIEAGFSPDGKYLAGLGNEGVLVIWDSETYRQLADYNTQYAGFFVWSPDSKMLADEYLSLYNLTGGNTFRPAGDARISSERPQGVAWSPNGKKIAASAEDFKLAIYSLPVTPGGLSKLITRVDYSDNQSIPREQLKLGKRVAFSPDSRWLAVANTPASGKISLFDATDGKLLFEINAGSKALNALSWPTPGLIMSGGADGTVRFWQIS